MSDNDYIKSLEKDNEDLRKKVEELTKELAKHDKSYNLNHIKHLESKSESVVDDALRKAIFKDYLKNKPPVK